MSIKWGKVEKVINKVVKCAIFHYIFGPQKH